MTENKEEQIDITLYSTDGCHLCELALQVIAEWSQMQVIDIGVDIIDIAADASLVDQYGMRIPVIDHHGQQLDWPFTVDVLQKFVCVGN